MNPWIAFIIGLIIGLLVGTSVGLFVCCLCVAAKEAERQALQWYKEQLSR